MAHLQFFPPETRIRILIINTLPLLSNWNKYDLTQPKLNIPGLIYALVFRREVVQHSKNMTDKLLFPAAEANVKMIILFLNTDLLHTSIVAISPVAGYQKIDWRLLLRLIIKQGWQHP